MSTNPSKLMRSLMDLAFCRSQLLVRFDRPGDISRLFRFLDDRINGSAREAESSLQSRVGSPKISISELLDPGAGKSSLVRSTNSMVSSLQPSSGPGVSLGVRGFCESRCSGSLGGNVRVADCLAEGVPGDCKLLYRQSEVFGIYHGSPNFSRIESKPWSRMALR